MTLKELSVELSKARIDPEFISLDGGDKHNTLCINFEDEKWVVYFSERGQRTYYAWFLLEEDACRYFLSRVLSW